MKIKIKRTGNDSVWDYIIVAFTIYITDALMFSTNINTAMTTFAKSALVVVTFGFIVYTYMKKRTVVLNSEAILFVIVIASILMTAVYNVDFSRKLFSKIVVLLFGFYFAKYYSLERYSRVYIRILAVISIVSIILYVGIDVLRQISGVPILVNSNNLKYYSVFISNIYANWPGVLRTPGPFWEPGAFQFYLIIGIAFVVSSESISQKQKIALVALFTGTVILTFSTTGFIALIPLFVSILFMKKNSVKGWLKWLIVLLGFTAIVVLLNNETIYEVLFSKITQSGNKSFDSRYNSIVDGIAVMLNDPIFGVGPVELENIMLGYSIVNTVIMHFSVYGVFVGLYFVLKILGFTSRLVTNRMVAILMFVAIVLSIAGENFVYSVVINLLIFLKPECKQIKSANQMSSDKKEGTINGV